MTNISVVRSAFALLLVACLMLFSPRQAWTESGNLSENEVKAAYLYNFAKYVEWPSSAFPRDNTPLTICIVGSGPLNDVIETLAGKTIRNRRLVIRQFSRIEDLSECHILFISSSLKSPLNQILTTAAARSILTVSDSKGFTAAGGMIEFIQVAGKIRFVINNRAAQSASLQISSHLLRLATTPVEKQ
jgi:hypothetical protein